MSFEKVSELPINHGVIHSFSLFVGIRASICELGLLYLYLLPSAIQTNSFHLEDVLLQSFISAVFIDFVNELSISKHQIVDISAKAWLYILI